MSVEAVKTGRVQALLNAPVSKKAIAYSEPDFLGHTQYYEKHLGDGPAVMSFYGSEFCLCLLTHHVPIKTASHQFLNSDLKQIFLRGIQGFERIFGHKVRACVCGFNPHAGEGGLLSSGEEERLEAVLKDLKESGIFIEGPIAADSLFIPSIRKNFDLIFACHHDQGLIPFKATHAPKGLSLTFGLKVLRATVDHGTAFDKAGKGLASCESMLEAWELMDQAPF
jgi:4-hydroxythreonine-4-phosphate dehydrogenase